MSIDRLKYLFAGRCCNSPTRVAVCRVSYRTRDIARSDTFDYIETGAGQHLQGVTDRDGNVITGRTQADGTVELSDLAAGLYAVTADGTGLVTAREPSGRVVGRKVTPLNIEMLARTQALEEIVVLARAQTIDCGAGLMPSVCVWGAAVPTCLSGRSPIAASPEAK